MIEANIELEFKDFWEVLFWQTVKSFWIMYLLTFVISIPMLIVYPYLLLTSPNAKLSPAVIFPLLPLLTVLFTQWSIYSSAKRSIDAVKGKSQWLLSDEGFKVFTAVARSDNSWESLEKVEEKKNHFLLYPQNDVFMIIPKRFFQGEKRIQEFRELVIANLGNKAKLRND